MNSPRVTIVDLARELGVSKTSVSAALHGSGRVSEETRQRVLAAAAARGYVSNRAAQQLRGGLHGAIGLHIPEDLGELTFYMEFAFGAAAGAAEAGDDLVLLSDATSEHRPRPSIDGLLALDPTPRGFPELVERVGAVPIVTIGEYRGQADERVDAWIAADHWGLTAAALDALAERGVTRPAIVGLPEPRGLRWIDDVMQSYDQWCVAHEMAPSVYRLPLDASDGQLVTELDLLAADGCDGVLWAGQGLLIRARTLQAAALSPVMPMATMALTPSELGMDAVIGVDLRAREYGREAARLLRRVIAGESEAGERVLHEAVLLRP